MTTSSWDRLRRIAAALSLLTVIAVVAGAVLLAFGVGAPNGWWPHTGQAFTADAHSAHRDRCALIVGPARAYCERGAAAKASAGHQGVPGGVWRLVPAGAGLAAFAVWRLRPAAGRRRR